MLPGSGQSTDPDQGHSVSEGFLADGSVPLIATDVAWPWGIGLSLYSLHP